MKHSSSIRIIAFLITLLVSKLAMAWPESFDQYFDVTHQQGKLLIGIKTDFLIDEDAPEWAEQLFNYLRLHGQLTIIVPENNQFIIGHTQGANNEFYQGNLAIVVTLPAGHPPIYIPNPPTPQQHGENDEGEGHQEGKESLNSEPDTTLVDITTIFTDQTWENIAKEFTIAHNVWQLNTELRVNGKCTLPLAQPTQEGEVEEEGAAAATIAQGQWLTYENWCAWATRIALTPLSHATASLTGLFTYSLAKSKTKKE